MILSFTKDEADRLKSLLRIARDENAREMQNVTVQSAEAEIMRIIEDKVCESDAECTCRRMPRIEESL